MKRFALIICGLLVLMAGVACAQSELKPLMPPYWIVGHVADTPEATVGNRAVYFYYDAAGFDAGNYAESVAFNNTFIINGFGIFPAPLVVGQTYKVSTEQIDSYGADGTVKISGLGWDEVKGMALYLGGGKKAPGAPAIKLWFGNRLYQPEVYWVVKQPGQLPVPFIVETKPEIKVEISIDPPYTLASAVESYSIVQDAGTADRKPVPLSAANASKTVTAGKVSAMTLKFTVPDPGLTDGEHTFTVTARSSGLEGPTTEATEVAKVEVMGGPARLFGPPITYPSPFSISKDKRVWIQYGLSTNANIEIYIISVGGERIFHRSFNAGSEGGSAGINKVPPPDGWNGRTDQGYLAGNAIYVGTIIARDENRLLGKFKLTIVD